MKKLALFLAFSASSPFTLYGKGGRILGRTQYVKFLRKQAIRMPDNGAEREEWTKQIFLACDVTTLPMPFLLTEDTSKSEDERYSHADIGAFEDASGLVGGKSDPDEVATDKTIQSILGLITSHGKLSREHLLDLLDEDELPFIDDAIEKAVKLCSLVQDGQWLCMVSVQDKKTTKTTKATKATKSKK